MPEDVIVGLKSLNLRGESGKMGYVPMMKRPHNQIFTEDELAKLRSLSTAELLVKHNQGAWLVGIWTSDSVINLTNGESARMASKMRYQMEVIMSIIKKRTNI